MSILKHTEILPITRIEHVQIVLSPGTSNLLVPLSNVTYIQTVVVKECPADATIRHGASTESAIPIVSQEVRDGLAFDSLYITSTTGGSLELEVQGR